MTDNSTRGKSAFITMLPEVLGEVVGSINCADNELKFREFQSEDAALYLEKIITTAIEFQSGINPNVVLISTETVEITPEFTSRIKRFVSDTFTNETKIMGINLGNSSNSSLAIAHALEHIVNGTSTGILCVLFDCFHQRHSRLLSGGLAALSDGGCSFYISSKPINKDSYRIASCTNVLHPSNNDSTTNGSISHFQNMTSSVKQKFSNDMELVVLNNYSRTYNEYFAQKIGVETTKLAYSEDYGHVSSSDTIINIRRLTDYFKKLTMVVNSNNMTGLVELVRD